jgi:AraC family transcriptional regulator
VAAPFAEFRPRMQSRTHALRTLAPLAFRRLSGAVADVWSVQGDQGGGGHYIAPDPRIVIFLDDTPPPLALRLAEADPDHSEVQAFYIPAGVPLWSRMQRSGTLSHLDVHLDAPALLRRLSAASVRADLDKPRLLASSPQLVALGRLAAAEVARPRRGDMLLDGLVNAALAEFFAKPEVAVPPGTGGLAPWQLAAVERHMRTNLSRPVTVAELAQVARLSESWFAHCFRQHTGETPHRWQARLRLQAALTMVESSSQSLAEIAHATGFSDQAHLSRVFRAAHGIPPSLWRRTSQISDGIPSE